MKSSHITFTKTPREKWTWPQCVQWELWPCKNPRENVKHRKPIYFNKWRPLFLQTAFFWIKYSSRLVKSGELLQIKPINLRRHSKGILRPNTSPHQSRNQPVQTRKIQDKSQDKKKSYITTQYKSISMQKRNN